MIDTFITYIQYIVQEFGVLGIFIATLIEQIIAPIPSGLVPIMAGFFLLPAYEDFFTILGQSMSVIALPVAVGVTLGSLVIYFIGYLGGKPIIEKSQKWFGFGWNDLERIKKGLDRGQSDEFVLFVLWLLPVVPSAAIAIFCGIIRYHIVKYILIAMAGSFLRATIMSLIGWQAGELYYVNVEQITLIENYILIGLGFLILTGIIFLFYKNKKRNYA